MLSHDATYWPNGVQRRETQTRQMAPEDLDDLLDVRLIASRTAVIGQLFYFPFIVLLLMLVARNRYFDNWDWPSALVLIFLLNSTYAIYSYLILRRAAEKARGHSLRRLSDLQWPAAPTLPSRPRVSH